MQEKIQEAQFRMAVFVMHDDDHGVFKNIVLLL